MSRRPDPAFARILNHLRGQKATPLAEASDSERYATAAAKAVVAAHALEEALTAVDGLEWSARLRESLGDVNEIATGLGQSAAG